MNGYAETAVFTPTVRNGDAMFIAGGIGENGQNPEKPEISMVSDSERKPDGNV
mgnify:CR=1 FL=1